MVGDLRRKEETKGCRRRGEESGAGEASRAWMGDRFKQGMAGKSANGARATPPSTAEYV